MTKAFLKERENGITLIALIITIIVLLMLAGVSIAMLAGENGILTQVNKAKEQTEISSKEEKIQLGDLSDFKIIQVSNKIKGYDIGKLKKSESYVGDFIKITSEDLKTIGLDFEGEYYVNSNTGEVYDIKGDKYLGITYHSIEELKQILYCSDDINVERLLNMKYRQIEYIKNNQDEAGAISTYTLGTDKATYTVNPYFNSIACSGLLNDIASFEIVKKYINWHFEHINKTADVNGIKGSIYDYKYENGNEISLSDYDSIDSYCSLFIILLQEYYERTGDKQLLSDNKDNILLVVNALDSMYIEELELTKTKETYNISYLMDNTESYKGYKSLAKIFREIFEDEENAKKYEERASNIKNSIEKEMWNTNNIEQNEFKLYDFAYKNSSYNGVLFDREYYPHILAQIYPVLYGLIDTNSDRAKQLYFLHSYYSEPKWFTYPEHSYPHMENLLFNLKFDNEEININSTTIDIEYERDMAISKILYWETMDVGEYKWNVQEAGNTISAINIYINKNIPKTIQNILN